MDHNQDSFGILRINLLISLELFISSKIYPDLRTSSLSVCLVAINGRRLKWEEWKVNEIWNVGHSCVRSKGMGVVSSSEEAPATSCLALESSIRWQDPNIWCQGGGALFFNENVGRIYSLLNSQRRPKVAISVPQHQILIKGWPGIQKPSIPL